MNLFFGDIDTEVRIAPEEQQHILKVLRLGSGDPIAVTDGKGQIASGLLRVEGKKALIEHTTLRKEPFPFVPALHLAIAPTKNIDRTEFFLEKATEMGVDKVTFIQCDHSERKQINIEKLQRQAIAACKQSRRVYFPEVEGLISFKSFIETIIPGRTFVAHCNNQLERHELSGLPLLEKITVLIGPEGDFSAGEIALLQEKGVGGISLGFQRLRTETAGLYVAAWNYQRMSLD